MKYHGNRRLRRQAALLEGLEGRRLFSAPPLPVITGPTFSITTYGAVGDGSTNNTNPIQNAINAASAAAISEANNHSALIGAVVEVPAAAGAFECGPITIPSNINLQIDSGATLQALSFATYPNATANPSHFITIKNDNNVEITGSGTIDGQGAAWWTAFNNKSINSRPRLINVTGTNTLLVQGVTLSNSPMFHLAISGTNNVNIDGITISAPLSSPNTDGMDLGGTAYLVQNCTVSTGDDDIVLKPQTTFCANITITNCTINSGHGLSVGGETNLGLNGLSVSNVAFNGTTSGIRLKAGRTTGGLVQNCTYSNITMTNVQYPININSYYPSTIPSNPQDAAQAVTALTPIWQNITISNLTATIKTTDSIYSSSYCGVIWGLPEEPVMNVTLSNVHLQGRRGMELNHVRGVTFDAASTLTALGGGPDEISDSGANVPFDAVITKAGWTNQDIGSPAAAGASLFDPNTGNWTLTGGGTGIGGTLDKFNLASIALSGDGGIAAKVMSQTNTSAGAEAGVMIRESPASNAAFAAVAVTPGNGVIFQWRSSDGALVQSTTVSGHSAPLYLEVTRQGNTFAGYYSSVPTGGWIQIGTTQTVTMTPAAVEGLAVTANSAGGISTAIFANVNTGPTVATAAAGTPNPVNGTRTNLSVLGADDGGEANLIYTWSATGPAPVTFSGNGTNADKNTSATFTQSGQYTLTATITEPGGLSTTSAVTISVTVLPPPNLSSFTINDGNVQRSMITSLTVVFDEPVTLGSGAITLSLRSSTGGGSTPASFVLSNPSSDQKTYVLTFTDPLDVGGSLTDGVYDLVVHAAAVQNAMGAPLAGGDQTFSFYRIYGDFNGTGQVGFASLLVIAQDYGITSGDVRYLSYVDINSDGSIGFPELLAVAQRYGTSLSVSNVNTAAALPDQTVVSSVKYTPPDISGATGGLLIRRLDMLASPPVKLES